MSLEIINVKKETNPDLLKKFKDREGFFIKGFFADDTFNQNDWGVTLDALKRDLATGLETRFFGKTAPVIMMVPSFAHPEPDEEAGENMITMQEPFRVGDFLDVGVSANDKAFFVAEIFDKRAQVLIETKEVNFISPSLRVIEHMHIGPRDLVTRFTVNHAALVKQPAFGMSKAQIRGVCKGKGDQCLVSFENLNAAKNVQGAIDSNDIRFSEDPEERKIIFTTQKDTKVDDRICQPLNGTVYDIANDSFPIIPDDTHINCRCEFRQKTTGKIVRDISSNFQATVKNNSDESKSMSGKTWEGGIKEGDDFKIAVCSKTGNVVIELQGQTELNKLVQECLSKKLKPGQKPTAEDLAICFSEAKDKMAKSESLRTNRTNPKSKMAQDDKTEDEKLKEQVAQLPDDEKEKILMQSLKAKAKSGKGVKGQDETETDDDKTKKEKELADAKAQAKANEDEVEDLKEKQKETEATIDEEIKKPMANKIASIQVNMGKVEEKNKQARVTELMKRPMASLKELHSDYSAMEEFKKNSLNDVPPGYKERYVQAAVDENEGKDTLSEIRGRMGST